MLFLALAFLGIFAFSRLGIDLLPNIYLPHLVVQTTYQNATPEEIEKLVTEPLESTIGTISGVKKITSLSKEGISVISVDFVWGTDMNYTVLQLREKLDNTGFALPQEAGRPTIIRADPSASPILSLVLSYKNRIPTFEFSKDSKLTSSRFVDHSSPPQEIKRLIDLKEAARVVFKRRLEQIDGVAQAILTGGLEREIVVEIDPLMMQNYGITFQQVSSALQSSNINLPAGTIMKGLFRYSLRTFGEFTNTEDIGNTIIKYLPGGAVLKLNDIAQVKENFKEREGLTRLNGAETVGLLIYKQPEANTVSIAKKVKDVINILRQEYPDFNLIIVSDQSGFIQNAITNVKQEILFGGILATIVLFFFLGSTRNIFAIAVTIPASLVITVLLMYLFKINFNIISLGGIAVGVGMLLDNSIVVIENIIRHNEKGLSLKESAIKGSSEVSMPVVAATLTTIVVFLPLIFVRGISGEIFRDQSLAIVFSLTASILAALTLIPMIVSRKKFINIDESKYSGGFIEISKPPRGIFKKIKFAISFPFVVVAHSLKFIVVKLYLLSSKLFQKLFKRFFVRVDKWMDKLIQYYERLLLWSLDNRGKVILFTIALAAITIYAAIDIKKEFIPESAQDEFVVELIFPKGTSLKGNAEITSGVEHAVLQLPYVANVVSNIGRVNEFDFLNKEQVSVNKTNLIIKLNSFENYYEARKSIRGILKNLSGIEYAFKQVKTTFTQLITPSDYDIEIKIKNKAIDKALQKATLISTEVQKKNISGIKEIVIGLDKGLPGYGIKVDREKCLAYGVNIDDVVNTIVSMVKGTEATYFSDFDKKIAVRVTTAEQNRDDINKVMQSEVRSNGKVVPLGSLVNYNRSEVYSEIRREDQARTLSVLIDIDEADLEEIIASVSNVLAVLPESKGEMVTIGGVNEEIHDSFSRLYIALIISVMLMYMILASEFESFLYPFIIIFSVPLGLIGGILLLYIFGESISIISLMGLIILIGIADNDAVVKVEFILRKRKEGLNVRDAIMQAGHDRFRPIVMNSLTVIFGLIPMIIGIGAATQLRISLALAIAGGLVSATVLTLIIIPVLFTFFERFSRSKEINEGVETPNESIN